MKVRVPSRVVLRASWVVPVDAPPIENGAVEIQGGAIASIDRFEAGSANVQDLGEAVLLPGFVNAHTHLELTHLAGQVPTERGFVAWIERLVAAMRACADAEPIIKGAVLSGMRQSLAAGVTAVGDISRLPVLTRSVLAGGRLRAVSFGEVISIGRLRGQLEARVAAATDATWASRWLRIGVSPHSPYLLEPDGLRACVESARGKRLPICTHVAETPDEELFTKGLEGPLRAYLERVGLWDAAVPCGSRRPVELMADCGALANDTILAHANYVSDEDIRVIAGAGAHVAYCPRTHLAFGHRPHRFTDMLASGVNVCVGTDSLASNPSLSVLEELRFLRAARPDVAPQTLLEMGTLNGARALHWADRIGSITPGKDADLVAIPLDRCGPADPVENILRSEASACATYVRGETVEAWPPS